MSKFNFHVQKLSYGWSSVVMHINDKEIAYNASYLGEEPLASMIEACSDLIMEGGNYYINWYTEPGRLQIDLHLDAESGMLQIDIFDKERLEQDKEWHETVPFKDFVDAIAHEGFRVLNAFGLYGYRQSWLSETDFPLTMLLRLTGKCKELWNNDYCSTDIRKEMKCLAECLDSYRPGNNEESLYDECTIYYESWQIQCCGEPFAVGERIDWTCQIPEDFWNAHGIPVDFVEQHHGFATHSISGTIVRIIAERSEFPKGQKEVRYDRANVIHEEIERADGWESELKDDETTERTFWGYVITLKDVSFSHIPLNSK